MGQREVIVFRDCPSKLIDKTKYDEDSEPYIRPADIELRIAQLDRTDVLQSAEADVRF